MPNQHNDNPKCKKCLYLGCNCDLDEAGECAYVTKPKFSPSWQGVAEERRERIIDLEDRIKTLEELLGSSKAPKYEEES